MKDKLFNILRPFGQEHLLQYWDSLGEIERQHLASQIESINFAQLQELYQTRDHKSGSSELADKSEPPYGYKFSGVASAARYSSRIPITAEAATTAGNNAICNTTKDGKITGKVGVILVAGGQGTRLGFGHAKGLFPIGAVAGTLLIRIHFEKVMAISQRAGFNIPLAVMTSPATHQEITESLENNNYFGFSRDDLHIFCQGTMPAVDANDGKVLLAGRSLVAVNPDGHGGMLSAIARRGRQKESGGVQKESVLEFFKNRGIEFLYYSQVDNPLAQTCSAEFLGYHILSGSEFSTQVICKTTPAEKCGNVIRVGESLYMVEYTELPNEVASRRNPDGSLFVWAGNTAIHAFNLGFLEKMSAKENILPFHVARKKVPYIDPTTGEIRNPVELNAIKFERFIFDILPFARNAVIVEVDAVNHYAPLKNASGAEKYSPEFVKQKMIDQHTNWLKSAGAIVAPNTPIEISPLFADSPETLKKKIKPNTTFNSPTYLTSPQHK
jgi:UDP-N-acetylglucosamine/UDP-N-acetylgalactosamine diphosphorylase